MSFERKSQKRLYFAIFLAFFVFSSLYPTIGMTATSFVAKKGKVQRQEHTNEILVKFRDEVRVRRIKVQDRNNFERLLERLQIDPLVEYAEPNFKVFAAAEAPNDPFYNQEQFYLPLVSMPQAWNYTTGEREVIVAVLDAGVDIRHPDLSRNIWVNTREVGKNKKDDDKNGYIDDVNGYNFVDDIGSPLPVPESETDFSMAGMQHGTVVSGIIGAVGNNAKGIAGVNWAVRILPLRVLSNKGEGNVADVIEGIDYAIAQGTRVLNMSFVGYEQSEAFDRAIAKAYDAGLVIVAAAGNALTRLSPGTDLDVTPAYPVCSRQEGSNKNLVLGVSALTTEDKIAFFSNYGEGCIDVSAPGVTMFSTQTVNKKLKLTEAYGGRPWSGSSFAAPLVSGVAALLLSINPHLTNTEVYDLLIQQGDNLNPVNPDYPDKLGRKLNAGRSLAEAVRLSGNTLPEKPKNKSKGKARFIEPRFAIFSSGKEGTQQKFFNYDLLLVKVVNQDFSSLSLGSRMIMGNVLGDAEPEVIAFGAERDAAISIYDINGRKWRSFTAFEGSANFSINAALADVDGDGHEEILAASRDAALPVVRIFNGAGKLLREILVYKGLKMGLSLAGGDLDGDGMDEIIVGAGWGGGPQVSVYHRDGTLQRRFFAGDTSLRGGVAVGSADIDKDGRDNILALALGTTKPELRIYTASGEIMRGFPIASQDLGKNVLLDAGLYNFDEMPDVLVSYVKDDVFKSIILDSEGKTLRAFDVQSLGVTSGGTGILLP